MAVYMFFFLFLLLLLSVFVLLNRNSRKRVHRLPPGPSQLPILGVLHELREVSHRSLWSLSKKYGSLVYLKLGRRPVVVVSSADMAREVMKSHDLHFCSRPSFLSQTMVTYNNQDLAFAPYGPRWRELRKISILELFSVKRVESFSSIRNAEVAEMIQKISMSGASPKKAVDLSEILFTHGNNIVHRAAYGKSYQGRDQDCKIKMQSAFNETRLLTSTFFFTDYLPQLGWIDVLTGLFGRLTKNCADLDSFLETIIQEHLDGPSPEKEDFIDALLRLQKDRCLVREEIKGLLLNVLFAGTDTSAAALEWAMSELMRNPTAMRKVQKEVRTVVQGKQQVEEGELHRLEFLKAVIKETLRLHPPAPLLIPRETIHHSEIAGYDIPPKTTVIVNAFAIGRDPKSWQNPEEFMSERFENSSIDYRGQVFEFIPFGAGRRGCPGISFGMVIVELALANLLYCFDWELPDGVGREELDMDESLGLVVQRRNPLHLVPIKK
ncbi:cytochrome P450 71A1-like [Aristolochia californica]|uniref:cytochrome P450 71A1-like n=1 Tax=Aristolochia californica TaxID=171875 RepID=UPI0035D62C36